MFEFQIFTWFNFFIVNNDVASSEYTNRNIKIANIKMEMKL